MEMAFNDLNVRIGWELPNKTLSLGESLENQSRIADCFVEMPVCGHVRVCICNNCVRVSFVETTKTTTDMMTTGASLDVFDK